MSKMIKYVFLILKIKDDEMKKLTLKDLQEKYKEPEQSIYSVIEYAQSLYPTYPDHPKKPFLKRGDHTSEEASLYAKELKSYENQIAIYRKEKQAYDEKVREIDEVIIAFIKEEASFSMVPKESQDKVWNKAWEDGHSSGYSEVYHQLCQLVELFC